MKKIIVGIFALLFLTGCSGDSSSQTLFVADKNDRFGLININGDKQTKFIYDKYESVGEYGYIVVKDKKYGYLSYNGEEIIELGKYNKLVSISNMIVAYDKNDNVTILSSEGKKLYDDKKTEILLSGLPIIHNNKDYTVLYDTGEILVNSKNKILSANVKNDNYMAVCFEESIEIYNQKIPGKIIKVDAGGNYQLMSYSDGIGYLFYDRINQDALACDDKGEVIFKAKIDLDDFYFDKSNNITGVKNQTTYLFDKKGTATSINSYYNSLDSYVMKNKNMIYGPHKFVNNGKEVEVNDIQLDPMASYINNKLFPVYVRNKGYMYCDFNGEMAFETIFTSAEIFDRNKLAVVSKKENEYYLMNQSGKKVSKKYDRIIHIGEKYYAGFVSSSKYEVIDTSGKKIIDDNFMDDGYVFTYNGIVYGIFNKSGTSYVYDMNELEVIFSVEGNLEFADDGYFVTENRDGYYSLTGEKIYTR
ncbi:membrane lipoprotein lipid attachment site-containing protein [Thomasclavelia cocleata]|uniref:membrane lipoprotein lipid attachment site-containing protein n=1 Tax=Thomasclavelia cocleata TaxID=69824 RepID=UPI00241CC51F|nr:membrane lipoprotein lipid attachment site-containing protein [Thomasclavelia cocleata]